MTCAIVMIAKPGGSGTSRTVALPSLREKRGASANKEMNKETSGWNSRFSTGIG